VTFRVLANIFLVFGLGCSFNVFAQDAEFNLHAETWDTQRHGEGLLKMPVLTEVVKQWSVNSQQKIELRYPGGEEGELWVEELKDWFVSLGIPSSAIQASAESNAQDIINIVLIKLVK